MNGLKITEIKIWPLRNPKPGTKLKANCRVTFNDCLSINGKLWNGKNGFFVGADGKYGDKKLEDGTTEQVYYPSWMMMKEHQQEFSSAVIQEYNKITGTVPNNPTNYTDHSPGNRSSGNNRNSGNEEFKEQVPF
jgi:DNA-binding cell septation regulator SpoVG